MKTSKIIISLSILVVLISFFYFDLTQYFQLEFFQNQKDLFSSFYNNHPILTILSFFILYVLMTGFSFPGAAILTLVAGYLFGLLIGTLLASFASTLGATLAFLMSRFLLKDIIEKKFPSKLKVINRGFDKNGIFYLLSLRLLPIFPFFIINLIMGLTSIKIIPYFFISQLGMLPGTIIYVNAGTQLSKIDSMRDILSPVIILSFVILALLPWIAKAIIRFIPLKKTR